MSDALGGAAGRSASDKGSDKACTSSSDKSGEVGGNGSSATNGSAANGSAAKTSDPPSPNSDMVPPYPPPRPRRLTGICCQPNRHVLHLALHLALPLCLPNKRAFHVVNPTDVRCTWRCNGHLALLCLCPLIPHVFSPIVCSRLLCLAACPGILALRAEWPDVLAMWDGAGYSVPRLG